MSREQAAEDLRLMRIITAVANGMYGKEKGQAEYADLRERLRAAAYPETNGKAEPEPEPESHLTRRRRKRAAGKK